MAVAHSAYKGFLDPWNEDGQSIIITWGQRRKDQRVFISRNQFPVHFKLALQQVIGKSEVRTKSNRGLTAVKMTVEDVVWKCDHVGAI